VTTSDRRGNEHRLLRAVRHRCYLIRKAMEWFWDACATDPAQRAEITASPNRASIEQVTGLPPAHLCVDEADMLRDEGEAYAAKLRSAGVPVTTVRYDGTIHDFMLLNARSPRPAPREPPSARPPPSCPLRRSGHGPSATWRRMQATTPSTRGQESSWSIGGPGSPGTVRRAAPAVSSSPQVRDQKRDDAVGTARIRAAITGNGTTLGPPIPPPLRPQSRASRH